MCVCVCVCVCVYMCVLPGIVDVVRNASFVFSSRLGYNPRATFYNSCEPRVNPTCFVYSC